MLIFLERFGISLLKLGLYEANTFTQWIDQLIACKLNSPIEVLMKDLPQRTTVYASKRNTKALVFDSNDEKYKDTRVAYCARCSMSIPFIFTPQYSEGLKVLDGGAQNNYPVEIFKRDNPKIRFIGLFLGPEIFQGIKKTSVLKELISIWTESSDMEALRKYRNETIIIDPITYIHIRFFIK